jgi:hypothetical protein
MILFLANQSWGSVAFWCGSGSVPLTNGTDLAPDLTSDAVPDPTPDPTPFFRDFKDAKKNIYFIFFSYNLPTGTLSSCLKIKFLLKFCVKILFCRHHFIPLNTFMRKGSVD